jgi:DNA-binding NtrC family response regulator
MAEKMPEVIILENDPETADSIAGLLTNRGYVPTLTETKAGAMEIIEKKGPGLVLIGNTEEKISVFDILKDIVMASPMTSVILVSDISPEEIHEKAEGYGILGHIGRNIDHDALSPLLETFEMITGALPLQK